MIKHNNKAQVHILEVVIVASMLFATLYFVQGLNTPTHSPVYEQNLIKKRADSALNTLDSISDEEYNTYLTKLIFTNDTENFTSHMNTYLHPCHSYSVYYYNLTNMYRVSSNTNNKKLWLNQWIPRIGEKTHVSRFIVYKGYLYEVVMELWYL